MLADAGGQNVKGLVRSALNMPNAQRDAFGKALDIRARGQFARIKDALDISLGTSDDFYKTTEGLIAARKAKGNTLFDAAFRQPTPYTVELQAVLNRPLAKRLIARASEAAANRGEKFKQFFVKQSKKPTFMGRTRMSFLLPAFLTPRPCIGSRCTLTTPLVA